jgi:hypothetical protein
MQRLRFADRERDGGAIALPVRQMLGERARLLERRDRFGVRVQRGRMVGAARQVVDRLRIQVGACIVMGNELGLSAHDVRVARFEQLRDLAVIVLARASQQRLVRGVLHQRMLEDVAGTRPPPALVEKLGVDEAIEAVLQLALLQRPDRLQHLVGEFAAENRAELRDFADRRQAIEPCHQHVLQRRRDGDVRERPHERVAALALLDEARVEDTLRQLLDVQRHAVGLLHDEIEHLRRHRLAARELDHQRLDVAALETVQRDGRHVRAHRPRGHEFGPVRHDIEDGGRGRLRDAEPEQRERRRIRPLHVFPDAQHGLPIGLLEKPGGERVERLRALLFGGEPQRRIAGIAERQRHQCRVKRYGALEGQALSSQHRFEARQSRLRIIVGVPSDEPLQVLDYRMERAAGVVRRAPRCDPRVLAARRLRA